MRRTSLPQSQHPFSGNRLALDDRSSCKVDTHTMSPQADMHNWMSPKQTWEKYAILNRFLLTMEEDERIQILLPCLPGPPQPAPSGHGADKVVLTFRTAYVQLQDMKAIEKLCLRMILLLGRARRLSYRHRFRTAVQKCPRRNRKPFRREAAQPSTNS